MNQKSKILILGCGYLGSRIAKQALKSGFAVDVLTRNEGKIQEMRALGVSEAVQSELQSTEWHTQLNPSSYQSIVISIGSSESSPEGYQLSYIEGLQSTLSWSRSFSNKLIYTSSISVYGQGDGNWFDETTIPNPIGWRGQTILNSENLFASHPSAQSTILRLGGIYGPDRNRFLKTILPKNQKPVTSRDYYLNLIEVDDAASAVMKAITFPGPLDPVYNLTDSHPFKREELDQFMTTNYPHLAIASTPSKHRSSPANRRINSRRIQEHLNWEPTHSSVFSALAKLV